MEKTLRFLMPLLVAMSLFSCAQDPVDMTTSSPSGAIDVKIKGIQEVAMDPWQVTITAMAGEDKHEVTTEIFADVLGEETKIVWTDEVATVTFEQTDGDARVFKIGMEEGKGILIAEN